MHRWLILGASVLAFLPSTSQAQDGRSVADWLEQLSGGSETERVNAARSLAQRGTAEALEGLLAAALHDESWDVQQEAAIAVVSVGGDISLRSRLQEAFAAESVGPRQGAASVWVELSTTPGSVVLAPDLVAGLSDPVDRIRYLCAASLYHLTKDSWSPKPGEVPEGFSLASALAPLLPLFTSTEHHTRAVAGAALGAVDGWVPASESLPILLPALQHESSAVRAAVATHLGWRRYTAAQREQVRAALAPLAEDPEEAVRAGAAASLEKLKAD